MKPVLEMQPAKGTRHYAAYASDVVSMDAVPMPPVGGARNAPAVRIWRQIMSAGAGEAVRVETESSKKGFVLRGTLRKKAKEVGTFLSSRYEADGTAFYFWIEPQETSRKPGSPKRT